VATRIKLNPMFQAKAEVPPGVLIFPTEMADSIVYVLISDSAADTTINVRDDMTGVALSIPLRSQHAAIAVIGKKERNIVARYGF